MRCARARIRCARARLVIAAVLITATSAVVGFASPANAATSMSISWGLPAGNYGVGWGAICRSGSSGAGYSQYFEYPTALDPANPIMPNPVRINAGCTADQVRMEAYFRGPTKPYDPLLENGAIAVRISPSPSSQNVGQLSFPVSGQAGTGHFIAKLLSRAPITNERVHLDIFEITGQHLSSTGYAMDAFSSGTSRGDVMRSGPLWNGQYLAFVEDRVAGTKAVGFVEVNGDTATELDLDMTCFGIDNCQFIGAVADSPGAFHPLSPTRIVDTRRGLGIAQAVQPGDGRNRDPDPTTRADSTENHQFIVGGAGGVPKLGVSAVLLNVTVTGGQTDGSLKVFPKPARTDPFDDQSSFGSNPSSTQVYWRAGEDSPNLVVAKVGVGGRVRLDSLSFGDAHVVVDVLGWYDEGQPGQSGSRLVALPPERALDTRNGIGGSATAFGAGTTRDLKVAGRPTVPAGATSVVATVTGVGPDSQTFVTAWPAGTPRQETSVLNVAPGTVRPNLATVPPGGNGNWSLFNERGTHHLLVDIVGYYTTAANAGGAVTAMAAMRVIDTQRGVGGGALGAGETRAVKVSGLGNVPGSAKAVFLNTTVIDGTAWSYLTVWPGGARPETSNLNWGVGDRRSNLVLVPVGPGGTVQVYNAFGAVDVAAEVVGWVS